MTGANRGIGLEMALTLAEAGARTVYCVDLPEEPSEDFAKVRDFVGRLGHGGRLEYISQDVTDQVSVYRLFRSWAISNEPGGGGRGAWMGLIY